MIIARAPEGWEGIFEEYEDFLYGEGLKENSVELYERLLKYFVEYMTTKVEKKFRITSPKDIKQRHINKYLADCHRKKIFKHNSYVPLSITLERFCNRFLKKKLEIPRYQVELDDDIDVLTTDEVLKLYNKANNSKWRAIIMTLYYGQLRVSELCSLDIEDILLETDQIEMRCRKGSKDKRSPRITLHPYNKKAILEYMEERKKIITQDGSNALFLSNHKKRMNRNGIWKQVKILATRARIRKRVYTHLFRHSGITHRAEAGASDTELQDQSGHRSLESLKRYIHRSPEAKYKRMIETAPDIFKPNEEKERKPNYDIGYN
jgi:integrase/recombinase XerD